LDKDRRVEKYPRYSGDKIMRLMIFLILWVIVMILVWLLGHYVEKSISLQQELDDEKLRSRHLEKVLRWKNDE